MNQFHYLLIFLILIISYINSNELIKINIKYQILPYEYKIRTKYGFIIYQAYTGTEFPSEKNFFYIELIDVKNITVLNFEELREEYKKYDIYVTHFDYFEEKNIIRINPNGNFEKSFMLITEIFYKTGYINKKLLIIDQKYENVY